MTMLEANTRKVITFILPTPPSNLDEIGAQEFESIIKPACRSSIREFVRSTARLVVNGPVLDVGCGYRTNEPELNINHNQYVAFDLTSPGKHVNPIISELRSDAKQNLVANTSVMPFSSETFPFIVCTDLLEHVSIIFLAMREIHRVHKPGGMLVLTLPGVDYPIHERLPQQRDYRRFTERNLYSILTWFGYKLNLFDRFIYKEKELHYSALAVKT